MSSSAATILGITLFLAIIGVTLLFVVSAKLRAEIQQLFRAFDRSERALVPLVIEVRTDRDRLAERLERLSDTGSDPSRR
ncbi:MAG: hypothetical protein JJE46_06940 [Acidimicrobiia bacterium]|nr:hypothetical protein [Acidimicrobiia bacterium]